MGGFDMIKEAQGSLLRSEIRMFVVPVDLLRVPHLTIYEQMAYIVIQKHANADGRGAFPSYSKIAKLGRMGRSTAVQAVTGLMDKGLIRKRRRTRNTNRGLTPWTSNEYRIVMPDVPPEDPLTYADGEEEGWEDSSSKRNKKGSPAEDHPPGDVLVGSPPHDHPSFPHDHPNPQHDHPSTQDGRDLSPLSTDLPDPLTHIWTDSQVESSEPTATKRLQNEKVFDSVPESDKPSASEIKTEGGGLDGKILAPTLAQYKEAANKVSTLLSSPVGAGQIKELVENFGRTMPEIYDAALNAARQGSRLHNPVGYFLRATREGWSTVFQATLGGGGSERDERYGAFYDLFPEA